MQAAHSTGPSGYYGHLPNYSVLARGVCPKRVLLDCGAGYILGTFAGWLFSFVGARRRKRSFLSTYHKGQGLRPLTSILVRRFHTGRRRAALGFARWTFGFSFFDCLWGTARGVADPLNPVLSVMSVSFFYRTLHWTTTKARFKRRRWRKHFFAGPANRRKWHRKWKRNLLVTGMFMAGIEGSFMFSSLFDFDLDLSDDIEELTEPWLDDDWIDWRDENEESEEYMDRGNIIVP